ncbi:MAG: hypothetical protein RBU37_10275 [Myxococcota bacterium]|nr:hypothetical protein [Myxococcota bacterium]
MPHTSAFQSRSDTAQALFWRDDLAWHSMTGDDASNALGRIIGETGQAPNLQEVGGTGQVPNLQKVRRRWPNNPGNKLRSSLLSPKPS